MAVGRPYSDDDMNRSSRLGYPMTSADGFQSPYERTLYYTGAARIVWPLVERAFAFLDTWEVAIPLHRYQEIAACYGDEADRRRTREAIGEDRLLLYNPHVIFVRRCAATDALLAAFEDEPGSRHHALLRTIYQVKPLLLALPVEWAAPGRGMDDMIRIRNARTPSGRTVTVQVGPNRYKKMDRREAIEKGLLPGEKQAPAAEDKMAMPAANKAAAAVVASPAVTPTDEGFDFTTIPGVGPATNRLLHTRGIDTLAAAQESELDFLPQKMRDLIREYDGEAAVEEPA